MGQCQRQRISNRKPYGKWGNVKCRKILDQTATERGVTSPQITSVSRSSPVRTPDINKTSSTTRRFWPSGTPERKRRWSRRDEARSAEAISPGAPINQNLRSINVLAHPYSRRVPKGLGVSTLAARLVTENPASRTVITTSMTSRKCDRTTARAGSIRRLLFC